jgi:hypothetical protein
MKIKSTDLLLMLFASLFITVLGAGVFWLFWDWFMVPKGLPTLTLSQLVLLKVLAMYTLDTQYYGHMTSPGRSPGHSQDLVWSILGHRIFRLVVVFLLGCVVKAFI